MAALQHVFDFSQVDLVDRERELEKLIIAHLPLVRKLSRKIHSKLPKGITEVEDLTSAGMFGLLDAAKRYEPSRQNSFETFAHPRIRGAIIDSLRADDSGTRTLRQREKTVEQTIDQLAKSFGRHPTEEEIVDALGMPLLQYRALVFEIWSHKVVSLDSNENRCEKSSGSLVDRIPDPSAVSPLELLEKKETNAHLARAIESLPEREKRVVTLYYIRGMTMKEIGEELGVMESYVSKIHAKAILKLKATMMAGGAPTSSHLVLNRGAERKALKPAQAELKAYRPIAALKLASALMQKG